MKQYENVKLSKQAFRALKYNGIWRVPENYMIVG